MKKYLLLLQLFFLYSVSFSQNTNSCIINNAGFESGNLTGWTAKSGYYGALPCPSGSCPRYKTVYTGGAVTSGALNAPLNSAGDRHTLMTAAGGNDPNSTNPPVPVIAPGGGNYSFRLGNANTGSINGTFAEAEAMRLTFPVTNQNASFTYRYAFFVGDGTHKIDENPSFEVVVLDQNDSIIPCGRYFVVAGTTASCVNTAGFVTGNNGYVYKPWTDVGLDLTGYIGQNISVEFRTTDCYPAGGSSSTNCSGNVCTYCLNGACCTYPAGGTQCVPSGGCSGAAGTHSAYAYIDAYCAPLDVQAPVFCAGATSIQICAPAGYASYSWPAGQPGLNGSPTTQCVTINNPVAGTTYTVNMVSATGCPTKTTVTLQGSNPAVNSTTICAGASTTLTATGGTGIYTWNTGATTSSIVVSPTVTTTYTVTTASTGTLNCPGIATATVTVGGLTPAISQPLTICAGGIATLSASGGTSYVWSPGGNTTSAISVSPTATTTYSVLVSNGGGCFGTISQTITVNNNITAFINPPPPLCIGSSITLIASGGTNYSWNTGDITPVIVVSPTSNTTYSVIVSAGTSCIDSASVNVVVNPLPIPTISPNTTICAGSSTSFTAGGGISYLWNTGSSQNPLVVTPGASTTYSVVITDANGCKNSISASVTLNASPTPVITGASPICAGKSTVLTVVGGQTFVWNTGETTASITVTPTTTTYSVIAFAFGCTNTTALTVTIVPAPSAVFSNTAPCEGAAVTYTDGSLSAQGDPINQWSWIMTGGLPSNSTSQNPISIYNTAGTYTTTLIITSKAGCMDTVTQKVVIYANPIALFKGGNGACASLCHTFMDSSQAINGTITNWSWNFPGGTPSSSTLQNPTICYNKAGSYGASLNITTSYGCRDTFSLNPVISVYNVPKADFCIAPQKAPATDPDFNFCDQWSNDVTKWIWSFGDNSYDSINTDPVHSYSAAVSGNDFYKYNVCLKVETRYGCWDSICKTVELIPEFVFYIPNTFTPNADGYNELFYGKGRGIKEFNIWVFDRWGNQIWDCHHSGKNTDWDSSGQEGLSAYCKWDGVAVQGGWDMNGGSKLLAPQDVYVWKVALTDVFERKHNYIGNVNILR